MHLSGVINSELDWDLPSPYPVRSGLIYNWQFVSKLSGQEKRQARFIHSSVLIKLEPMVGIMKQNTKM